MTTHIISDNPHIVQEFRSRNHYAMIISNPRSGFIGQVDIFTQEISSRSFRVSIYRDYSKIREFIGTINRKAHNGLTGFTHVYASIRDCLLQQTSHYRHALLQESIKSEMQSLLARMSRIETMLQQDLQRFDSVAPVADGFSPTGDFIPFATSTRKHIRNIKIDYQSGIIRTNVKRSRVPEITKALNDPYLGCKVDNVDWNEDYPELVIRLEK